MDLTCVYCKKQLCRQTTGGPKMYGYYLYDDKAYCVDCWKSGKCEDHAICSTPEPKLAT